MKEFYTTLTVPKQVVGHLNQQRMFKIIKGFKFKLQNWRNHYEHKIKQSNQ